MSSLVPFIVPGPRPNPDSIRFPRFASAVASAAFNGIVEEPICIPDGPNETTVPSIVTAEPSSATVLPATTNPVGAAVKVSPAIVKIDCGFVGKAIVLPLAKSARPSEAIEYVVPDKAAGGPPALIMAPLASVIACRSGGLWRIAPTLVGRA